MREVYDDYYDWAPEVRQDRSNPGPVPGGCLVMGCLMAGFVLGVWLIVQGIILT